MFTKSNPDNYKTLLEGVTLKTLAHGVQTHLTEVHFVKGAIIPIHKHLHEQTGRMISGTLRFTIDNDVFDAHAGDGWNIPSNVPHSAEALEDAVVVEVFSPVREDYLP
jgi:quercetin dioxygenase-like cupin family protein